MRRVSSNPAPRGGRGSLVALNAALIIVVLVAVALSPPANGPVAVFVSPWGGSAAEIVARADGRLVAAGGFPWVVIANSDGTGFVQRLYDAGAWLVSDPRLAVGCRASAQQGP